MDTINQLLELSPPVALALALNLVGYALKKSPLVNWTIPLLLIIAGACVYPFIAEIGKVSYAVRSPDAFNAVVGACCGGLAIGLNQVVKQIFPRDESGETKFLFKPAKKTKADADTKT